MKKNEAAYLAGLIDGEGCISVVRLMKRNHFNYVSRIQISLTNKDVLDWVRDFTKVGTVVPRKSKFANRKMAWLWVVESNRAVRVSKIIQPFLKIKSKQIKNLLAFQSVIRKHNSGRRFSLKEIKVREHYYQISRKLNGGRINGGRPI